MRITCDLEADAACVYLTGDNLMPGRVSSIAMSPVTAARARMARP